MSQAPLIVKETVRPFDGSAELAEVRLRVTYEGVVS